MTWTLTELPKEQRHTVGGKKYGASKSNTKDCISFARRVRRNGGYAVVLTDKQFLALQRHQPITRAKIRYVLQHY